MSNYQEARVKLTNTQLNKLKSATKHETGTTLRITQNNFQDKELPHELFLATRQTTKIRNAFANNMSTDINFSKAHISKIVQSAGSFGSWLGNLGQKSPTNVPLPFARDNLPGLVRNITWNAIKKFEIKVSGKEAARAEKGFTLFILNEDMNEIIKIIKSLEDLGLLIGGVTETVKHKMKKEGWFLGALLAPLAASLVQPMFSSVVKGISGRGVRRTGKGCMDKNF